MTKLAFLIGAVSCAAFATQISFPDFGLVEGAVLNGAAEVRDGAVRLVPNRPFAAGALGYVEPLHIAAGFTSEVRFRLAERGAMPGDGLAFLVQDFGPAPLGPAGGALGYYGIPRSVAVEVDVFRNVPPLTDYADPNANHVAIQSCGSNPNTPAHNVGCTLALNASPGVDVADGALHALDVSYSPGLMRVFLDNALVLSSDINLPVLLGSSGGDAWLSMTAATGGATAAIDITYWTATEAAVPEPSGVLLFASGLAAMLAIRRGRAVQAPLPRGRGYKP